MTKNHKILVLIIVIGFFLRLLFSFQSDHIYYPDEIFQTVEISFRLVTGYGIIPWDYAYGLRSLVLPIILSAPLKLLSISGFLTPDVYIPIMKTFLSAISLVLIPAAYLVTKKLTRSEPFALLSAWSVAIWYELIYFSPRALTEIFSVYLFAATLLTSIRRKPYLYLTGLFLTGASLMRPQYFPATIFFVFYLTQKQIHQQKNFLLGALTAIATFALADWYFYGTPLIHLFRNWQISFQSGISQIFGQEPTSYYISAFFSTSLGLLLTPLIFYHRQYRGLYYTYLSILVLHSLITHKEYRFLFILIPLGLTLISLSLYKKFFTRPRDNQPSKVVPIAVAIGLLSWLGSLSTFPSQTLLYPQPFLMKDGYLQLTKKVADLTIPLCGIYSPERSWVYTGGYYYLGTNLPYYSHALQPSDSSDFNLVISTEDPSTSSARPIAKSEPYDLFLSGTRQTNPSYFLYQYDQNCPEANSPNYYRSFESIEEHLRKYQFEPILNSNRI